MRFPKCLIILVGLVLSPGVALAAVGVTSSELQSAIDLIVPAGSVIQPLDHYEAFNLTDSFTISGGIMADYEARLSGNIWVDEELPHLQILAYSYSSQTAAEQALASMPIENVNRTILDEQARSILYSGQPGVNVDVFNKVTSEERSLHLLHVNGNVLYQASLYRGAGEYNQANVEAFDEALTDWAETQVVLMDALNKMKLSLGILFPPTSADFSGKSEKTSLNLSELYDIPAHGEIQFELYVGAANSAVGTLFDSSGISTPVKGDIYLYLQNDGRLLAGIYAPDFDADCDQQSGWYRILSKKPIYSYEWNSLVLHFGVGGFWLEHEGVDVGRCSVSQPRSDRDLYFGDYPGDSIEESVIGSVNDLTFVASTTDSGLVWDEVLEQQLFLDLPNTDPDVAVFQYLKESGVFLGSDGMLFPNRTLNRAEMVKILLKAYGYSSEGGSVPFWDVPAGAWYKKYLSKAYEIGMVKGHDDGRFLPGHEINRAEFYTMLHRVSGSKKMAYDGEFEDVNAKDWFVGGASFALKNGLMNAGTFNPTQTTSRREAARALYTLLK